MNSGLPIACALTAAELPERLAGMADVGRIALVDGRSSRAVSCRAALRRDCRCPRAGGVHRGRRIADTRSWPIVADGASGVGSPGPAGTMPA